MKGDRAAASTWLRDVLAAARYEVLPTAKVEQAVIDVVPRDVRLTVTASPAKGLGATLDLTERLVGHGYSVVPHLAARMISGRAELGEIVDRLTAIGVDDVFCPAGDADPPAGEYDAALPLLEHLSELGKPFPSIGITGYPESHPTVPDDVMIKAMWDKHFHATYIVSNLCFDPKLVARWVRRVRDRGVDLPLFVGTPGQIERTKLLVTATRIGVGQSVRFLKGHASMLARLVSPGGFTAERFLARAAPVLSEPDLRVAGLHIFTFNQVAQTERWRQGQLS